MQHVRSVGTNADALDDVRPIYELRIWISGLWLSRIPSFKGSNSQIHRKFPRNLDSVTWNLRGLDSSRFIFIRGGFPLSESGSTGNQYLQESTRPVSLRLIHQVRMCISEGLTPASSYLIDVGWISPERIGLPRT